MQHSWYHANFQGYAHETNSSITCRSANLIFPLSRATLLSEVSSPVFKYMLCFSMLLKHLTVYPRVLFLCEYDTLDSCTKYLLYVCIAIPYFTSVHLIWVGHPTLVTLADEGDNAWTFNMNNKAEEKGSCYTGSRLAHLYLLSGTMAPCSTEIDTATARGTKSKGMY
jgi:hypothetical protein